MGCTGRHRDPALGLADARLSMSELTRIVGQLAHEEFKTSPMSRVGQLPLARLTQSRHQYKGPPKSAP
jgi:hypothetical protein